MGCIWVGTYQRTGVWDERFASSPAVNVRYISEKYRFLFASCSTARRRIRFATGGSKKLADLVKLELGTKTNLRSQGPEGSKRGSNGIVTGWTRRTAWTAGMANKATVKGVGNRSYPPGVGGLGRMGSEKAGVPLWPKEVSHVTPETMVRAPQAGLYDARTWSGIDIDSRRSGAGEGEMMTANAERGRTGKDATKRGHVMRSRTASEKQDINKEKYKCALARGWTGLWQRTPRTARDQRALAHSLSRRHTT